MPKTAVTSAANKSSATTGLRMPAEWEPHEATWLGWPHEKTDWPGKFAPIPWVYTEIVRHLACVERVRMLVQNGAEEDSARRMLKKARANLNAVEFFRVPTNRGWTRDFGPTFVRDASGGLTALHWLFNAWSKYDDGAKDAAAVTRLAKEWKRWKIPVVQPVHHGKHVVLEGGGIESNGRGLVMTTEEWLLSNEQERNPGFSRADYGQIFREYLGAKQVIWLGRGIAGDDTHGHVDDIARFTAPDSIVTVVEADRSEANFEPLQENLARLREVRDQDGKPMRVTRLPMPAPVFFAGQRLPASYANFYVANRIVLVPTFNDPNDRVALNTLAEHFHDRQVIGIAAQDLVLGLGTIHCMTQQQPARG
ncbi:MAG TPA: agmatine deiminase family protein [Candidatus Acidoferrales bacterium]|jgi:agmatine deiminase|nr:agmatine deiminase family protein [Candidatus Acidoferrales bacterium]